MSKIIKLWHVLFKLVLYLTKYVKLVNKIWLYKVIIFLTYFKELWVHFYIIES